MFYSDVFTKNSKLTFEKLKILQTNLTSYFFSLLIQTVNSKKEIV